MPRRDRTINVEDRILASLERTQGPTMTGLTTTIVVKPFVHTNATDPTGVVHRVVSLAGVMNLCTARCGLEGKWSHEATRRWASTTVTMTWTDEALSCMTCIVKEAERAAA